MALDMTKEEIMNSLRVFKERRDDLMHEDTNGFAHFAERFIEFCETNPLMQLVLKPLQEKNQEVKAEDWWKTGLNEYSIPRFPKDADEELVLRFKILESIQQEDKIYDFTSMSETSKISEGIGIFRSLVLRPLMQELTQRISTAGNLATPEAREIQAVPLVRIPSPKEIKIFLSHKSNNKDIVRRYNTALKSVGFDPWFDEAAMDAGANLERELIRGFNESCAVVFFMTEHFKDEKYLATEIDYAVQQKMKKEKKFSIITLRYPGANEVPDLLQRFIWRDIENDLVGFHEIIKALPIELGPVRWKSHVVE
jgi:hypothetical protein